MLSMPQMRTRRATCARNVPPASTIRAQKWPDLARLTVSPAVFSPKQPAKPKHTGSEECKITAGWRLRPLPLGNVG